MHFTSRRDAAQRLATALVGYTGRHPLVLGVPRGGVPMARIIADALEGDLDVVLVHKLRAPDQPELAIGAVDEHGTLWRGAGDSSASDDYVREEARRQVAGLRHRRHLYAGVVAPVDPAGRIVIIVDDGMATGASALAAVHAVRVRAAREVVIATAVAPPSTLARMRAAADVVVCLHPARDFIAVGQYFDDFSEVTDEMVIEALTRPAGTPGPGTMKGVQS